MTDDLRARVLAARDVARIRADEDCSDRYQWGSRADAMGEVLGWIDEAVHGQRVFRTRLEALRTEAFRAEWTWGRGATCGTARHLRAEGRLTALNEVVGLLTAQPYWRPLTPELLAELRADQKPRVFWIVVRGAKAPARATFRPAWESHEWVHAENGRALDSCVVTHVMPETVPAMP